MVWSGPTHGGVAAIPDHTDYPADFPELTGGSPSDTDKVAVYIAERWPDDADDDNAWTAVNYLEIDSVKLAESPDIGFARFRYQHGAIARPGAGELTAELTRDDLVGKFCRVVHELATGQRFLVFVGVIQRPVEATRGAPEADAAEFPSLPAGSALPSGVQQVVAYELSILLSQQTIESALVYSDAAAGITGADTVYPIRRPVVFNLRGTDAEFIGNRTLETVDGDPPFVKLWRGGSPLKYHAFARESDSHNQQSKKFRWTGQDVGTYLCALFNDDQRGPAFRIGGSATIQYPDGVGGFVTDAELIVDQWDVGGQSFWAALNAVFDPRQLFSFNVQLTDGGVVTLNVHTNLDADLPFPGGTFHANPDAMTINADGNANILNSAIKETTNQKYNRIVVKGKPIVVCCTLAGMDWFGSPSVTPRAFGLSWDTSLVGQYNAADAAGRASELFSRLWRVFRLESGFDFRVVRRFDPDNPLNPAPGVTPPAGTFKPIIPRSNNFGTLDIEPGTGFISEGNRGFVYPPQIRLLSWIPLAEQVRYDTAIPPVDFAVPTGGRRRYKSPLILGESSRNVAPYKQWIDITNAVKGTGSSHASEASAVFASKDEPGFVVQSPFAHFLGKNDFVNTSGESNTKNSEFDYNRLLATVAFEIDDQLRFVVELGGQPADPTAGTPDTELHYLVNAECWYIPVGTVIDTKTTDGSFSSLVNYEATQPRGWLESDGEPPVAVSRIDTDRVVAVAQLLRRWYGQTRRSVEFETASLAATPELGALLTFETSAVAAGDIKAPVTSIAIDYSGRSPRIMVQTGWHRLDPRKFTNFGPGQPLSTVTMGRVVAQHEAAFAEIRAKINAQPMRQSTPAATGADVGTVNWYIVQSGTRNPYTIQQVILTGSDPDDELTYSLAGVPLTGFHVQNLPLAFGQLIEGAPVADLTNYSLITGHTSAAILRGTPQFTVSPMVDAGI